ncbi:hypothetical protein TBLA_0C05400 [Henningerozyma blattae CBS 6284]|uniref:NADP-dependent oxidoreductase domain-containing protein n=1 Tax=Henningerozyma blattae (strain ATCC 34711 / CBS 6284 / DSM 70876 / NBRC 10599 / NRRL Y-10934 / UCD 77-7) TaxID=1071380 RepID=I2H1T6_HENB6|nr:hypothetical protein TBLA_0C05400 [Tetrapisispora blattae CBS 6284]CCH60338.1 hypothetical protein TBLA_0C05400 [Tetrapisispora blattae CBS 6284]
MSQVQQLRKELEKIDTSYGLMSLTWRAEPIPKEQAFAAMEKVISFAIENNRKAFFNIGEFYGPNWSNLKLVNDFFIANPTLRKNVIISCKGGVNNETLVPKGKAAQVKQSVEACCKEVGGFIDIYEVARLDLAITPEGKEYPYETFEELAKLVDDGVIGGISLSEVNEKQIRAIHKDWSKFLTCVEVELSLFSTNILHDGVAKTCGELDLVIICYSPLGRGLLTGQIKSVDDIPDGDFRKLLKRFHGDAMQQNLLLVKFLKDEIVAKRDPEHPIELTQIALAWIKHWNKSDQFNGAKFIPNPSGSSVDKVTENFNEKRTQLSEAEFEKINDFLSKFKTEGDRYEMV